MGDVYQFPGGEMPPDFETKMPDDLKVRYCYRHPDRETGVSCSNCGRPICHECMIPAPVGFRCPECVREQNARGSRSKVVTRGQIRSRWSAGAMGGSTGVSATKVLVVLNVAMFVIELFTGASALLGGGSTQALVDLGALWPRAVVEGHDYWRLFTAMFLHSGIIHIGLNMWALWVLGGFMEVILGRLKFVLLYFISGLAGSVLVLVAAPMDTVVVGASGAIFGMFGALGVHAYLHRGDFRSSAFLRQIMLLIFINLMFTFTWGGISWQAHIGGLVGGAVTMYAMMLGGRKDPRGRFQQADALAVAGFVLLLVAIVVWRVIAAGG